MAPTLTSATLVPNSFPDALSRNIAYGVSHGRIGRLASSTPMPGTITTSWRRTQDAVRTASTPLPSTLSPVRQRAGCALLERMVPVQGGGLDAVLAAQPVRARAHGVHDGVGMVGPQVVEHGLHRGVVTDVARAQQPEQADPGEDGAAAVARP